MPFRLSVRVSRTAVFAGVLLFVSACKAGESGPGLHLQPSKSSVRPYETLLIDLGAPVTAATLPGTLGAEAVTAARVNDSTFSLIIPPVTPGSYELSLNAGGNAITTQITVIAAPVVANPAGTVDSVAASVEAGITAVEASFVQLATDGADTVAMKQQLTALRAKIQSWRADLAAASPQERAQVAAFFAANPGLSLTAFDEGGSLAAGATFAASVCQDGTGCMGELEKTVRRLAVGMAVFAGGMIAAKAASWLGGLASKITVEGVQIVAAGVLLGYVANGIGDIIRTPVVPTATPDGQGMPLVAAGPVVGSFVIGTPGPLEVTAQYASLTSADLATPPASALGVAMKFLQDTWSTIASAIPFVSLPTPSFPSTPARKVIAPIPASQLAVTALTPTDFTVTATAQGVTPMLNFANAKAGANHEVGMTIRFSPPGFPQQTLTRTVLVRPAVYAIASVLVAPGTATIGTGVDKILTAFVRDSSGDVIPVESLTGRIPTWTSSNESVATVSWLSTSAAVHGSAIGTTIITATAGGKQGQATVTVEDPPFASHYRGTASAGGLIGNEGTCQYGWDLINTLITVDYDAAPAEGESRSVSITMSGTATRQALLGSIDAGCPTNPVPFSATFTGTATGRFRTFDFQQSTTLLGWNLFIPQGGVSYGGPGGNEMMAGGRIRFSPGYGGQQPEIAFQIPVKQP